MYNLACLIFCLAFLAAGRCGSIKLSTSSDQPRHELEIPSSNSPESLYSLQEGDTKKEAYEAIIQLLSDAPPA